MTVRILLVEDDIPFAGVLIGSLRRLGHEVIHVPSVALALAESPVDLILLDLGLPDGDGLGLCRRLRARSDVGIIVITARAEERDRVAGLRGGADDYLIKPFGVAELQARIEAVTRRTRLAARPPDVRVSGGVRVDLERHRAFVNDDPVALTRKEFQLLTLLLAEPGAVVRRERILAEVWQTSWRGTSRTLDVHIATLRAKLGDSARLETVRGVGYRLC
jgi:DNA-binding response OmpR family regulator